MSTIISGYYTTGITLSNPAYNPVSVTGTVNLSGAGPALYGAGSTAWTIANSGTLEGGQIGVTLNAGGSVSNGDTSTTGAYIAGASGIVISGGAGTVVNDATIAGAASGGVGVDLGAGGSVTNGSTAVGSAKISGYRAIAVYTATGMVANYATITSAQGSGVYLAAGGVVTNGASGATGALISGYAYAIAAYGLATISNAGTLLSQNGISVYLDAGGAVSNDSTGLISGGYRGAQVAGAAGTVVNAGTITAAHGDGIYLGGGGVVTNGGAANAAAKISGNYFGIAVVGAAGTVSNYGTISSRNGTGVYLQAGGSVVNGDAAALITGRQYGVNAAATATISNDGTITSSGGSGIYLNAGGSVSNGTATYTGATISGHNHGIVAYGAAAQIANLGTITASVGTAIYLAAGGSVTNGTGAITQALISGGTAGIAAYAAGEAVNVVNHGTVRGAIGIVLSGSGGATVTNAGAITGTGGTAIQFGAGPDRLIVDPGATFGGTVVGGSGPNTLELASAASAGTLNGIGSSFAGFGAVVVDAGAVWTLTGTNSIGAGGTLTDGGKVVGNISLAAGAYLLNQVAGYLGGTVYGVGGAASITNLGTLRSTNGTAVRLAASGSISNGAGGATSALIAGSSFGISAYAATTPVGIFNAGSIQGATGIYITGAAGATITNAGKITGTGGVAIRFGAGTDRLIVDPGAAFGGTVIGGIASNTLELASAASAGTLNGLGSNFVGFSTIAEDTGARWTLTGNNTLSGGATITQGTAATLSVAGSLDVAGSLTLAGKGVFAVTNTGTEEIGTAGGARRGRLTVDNGASLIGTGTLSGPVTDNGTIVASGGTLRLSGTVTGTGAVAIDSSSVLSAAAALSISQMTFVSGSSESLLLGRPTSFSGTISGFGVIGTKDRIDLQSFSVTAASVSGSVLSLSSAGGVVNLHFAASYSLTAFRLASDGHNGTNITFV